jgi:hypothetical protein
MPNWVNNTLSITAPKREQLEAFIAEMTRPHPEAVYEKYEFTGEIVESEEVFSFWNLVAPPAELLVEYFGKVSAGDTTPDRVINWYDWNSDNWGTKWDANDTQIDDDGNEITIRFMTPWDVPRQIVLAMAEKYPDIQIEWHFMEEQHWGGMFSLYAGHAEEVRSWDIPTSHAEYEAVGMGYECVCDWSDNESLWFSDCSRTVTKPLSNLEEPTI